MMKRLFLFLFIGLAVCPAFAQVSPQTNSQFMATPSSGTGYLGLRPITPLDFNNGTGANGSTCLSGLMTWIACGVSPSLYNLAGTPLYNGVLNTTCSIRFGSSFTQLEFCNEITGTHNNGQESTLAVIRNVDGSGIFGTAYADIGAMFSEKKHCYISSDSGCSSASYNPGELDALSVTTWQGAQGDGGSGQFITTKVRTGITASFTGTISGGTTLTVSSVSGTIQSGETLTNGAGLALNTTIVSGSGNSWIISPSQGNIGPEYMTASLDSGGTTGLGDIAAQTINPSGTPIWEVHSLISFQEAVGGMSSGAGYGMWTEAFLGVPFAAYEASTFNAYSGAAGSYGFIYAFAASHDRALADQYFSVAGDLVGSNPGWAESPGDINQGSSTYGINLHTDGSGTWGVRYGNTYEFSLVSGTGYFQNSVEVNGAPPALSNGKGVLFANSSIGGGLIGQGTSNDLTFYNHNSTIVMAVATGSTTVYIPGALAVAALPTTGTGGGLYACVDTAGNMYRKSSCP